MILGGQKGNLGIYCREGSLVGWVLGAVGEEYKKLFEEDNWAIFTYHRGTLYITD